MANNTNLVRVGEGNNAPRCPSADFMGEAITNDPANVLVLQGTDGETYCFTYDTITSYIDMAFGDLGFFGIRELPLMPSLERLLVHMQTHHPDNQEIIDRINQVINPPGDPTYLAIPEDFVRLMKRIGLCLRYLNDADDGFVARMNRSRVARNKESQCRLVNLRPYFNAISEYMNSLTSEQRNLIDALPFEGYLGRSRFFYNNVRSGTAPPRDITFQTFRERVMAAEVCMGTLTSNFIKFYNKLVINRAQRAQVIDTQTIISAEDYAATCPAAVYTNNNSTQISTAPLFRVGGQRKTTKKKRTQRRKTRQRRNKN